jgi:hypothetical protein
MLLFFQSHPLPENNGSSFLSHLHQPFNRGRQEERKKERMEDKERERERKRDREREGER